MRTLVDMEMARRIIERYTGRFTTFAEEAPMLHLDAAAPVGGSGGESRTFIENIALFHHFWTQNTFIRMIVNVGMLGRLLSRAVGPKAPPARFSAESAGETVNHKPALLGEPAGTLSAVLEKLLWQAAGEGRAGERDIRSNAVFAARALPPAASLAPWKRGGVPPLPSVSRLSMPPPSMMHVAPAPSESGASAQFAAAPPVTRTVSTPPGPGASARPAAAPSVTQIVSAPPEPGAAGSMARPSASGAGTALPPPDNAVQMVLRDVPGVSGLPAALGSSIRTTTVFRKKLVFTTITSPTRLLPGREWTPRSEAAGPARGFLPPGRETPPFPGPNVPVPSAMAPGPSAAAPVPSVAAPRHDSLPASILPASAGPARMEAGPSAVPPPASQGAAGLEPALPPGAAVTRTTARSAESRAAERTVRTEWTERILQTQTLQNRQTLRSLQATRAVRTLRIVSAAKAMRAAPSARNRRLFPDERPETGARASGPMPFPAGAVMEMRKRTDPISTAPGSPPSALLPARHPLDAQTPLTRNAGEGASAPAARMFRVEPSGAWSGAVAPRWDSAPQDAPMRMRSVEPVTMVHSAAGAQRERGQEQRQEQERQESIRFIQRREVRKETSVRSQEVVGEGVEHAAVSNVLAAGGKAVPPQEPEEAVVSRLADRIYRKLETRLHAEKIRRGMF